MKTQQRNSLFFRDADVCHVDNPGGGGSSAGARAGGRLLLHKHLQHQLLNHALYQGARAFRIRLRKCLQEHTLLRQELQKYRVVSTYFLIKLYT